MDNTKQIPEPLLTNVKEYAQSVTVSDNDKCLIMDGAQYGYNLAQVYVNDLEKIMRQTQKAFDDFVAFNTKHTDYLEAKVKELESNRDDSYISM